MQRDSCRQMFYNLQLRLIMATIDTYIKILYSKYSKVRL